MDMRRRTLGLLALGSVLGAPFAKGASHMGNGRTFRFASLDGGVLDLAEFRGGPVLVVNTASRCAFTDQYDALQALYDRYRGDGLTVVGVPSDSFRQELGDDAAVRDFCEVNFGIDFPMSRIVAVTGKDAHPFYRWAADQGVVPRWNFHKVLLGPDGALEADFATSVPPDAPQVAAEIEGLLAERGSGI